MTRASAPQLRFAAIGLNHSHIYGQTKAMLDAGAQLVAVHAEEDDLAHQYVTTFAQAKRVADRRAILEDTSIKLVVSAITPKSVPRRQSRSCGTARTSWSTSQA